MITRFMVRSQKVIEKNSKLRIFETGATGFVGASLIKELLKQNYHTSVSVRNNNSVVSFGVTKFKVGHLTAHIYWLCVK
jgi:nucleoside-diphosphate-sugar epimerase